MDRSERISRSQGCLLLGAIGDALGAAVEFLGTEQIKDRFGPEGIVEPALAYGVNGPITDDTQMALFAADGLLSAYVRGAERGILADYWTYVAKSYRRWLVTQDQGIEDVSEQWGSPELFELVKRQGPRAPGNTCISALEQMSTDSPATPAINNSKGCGTVMRVAPVGLFASNFLDASDEEGLREIYKWGSEDAAITHGHENAHNSSGVLAAIVAAVVSGTDLPTACRLAIDKLANKEVAAICNEALRLAADFADAEHLESLGEGWVAEEALAMAIYCAVGANADNIEPAEAADALRLSVNHGGDSDSVGALTGNLIGVAAGMDAVPQALIAGTEVEDLEPLIGRYGQRLVTAKEYVAALAPPPPQHGWPD